MNGTTEREYKTTPEAREGLRNYMREWRAKNPERVREIQREYWKRRGERERAEREKREGGNDEET